MRLTTLVVLVVLLSVSALAENISGTWLGESKSREGGAIAMTAILKADNGKLTGRVNLRGTEFNVENGTIRGDDVKFDATISREGETLTFHYTGKVEGVQLKLHSQRDGAAGTRAQNGQEWTLSKK